LRVSSVVESGKVNVNTSGNYTLTVSCAITAVGSTVTFQVTADTGGALGAGTTSRVSCEAELIQYSSSGAMYLQAV
jgi:hypothetical protein